MSSPTQSVYAHATSSAGLPVASALPTQPPIVHFARAAGHALALSFSYLSQATTTLARLSFAPLALVSAPIIYLLSPIIVLSQVLLQLFVFSPYNLVTTLLRNIYPIYVFVGIACICAAFFGFVARMITQGLAYVLFAPRPSTAISQEPNLEARTPPSTPAKTRLRKRVSIKEER